MAAEIVYEVEHIDQHFRKDEQALVALRNVNLRIEQGTFLVLLGRSGCGKSTLLNLLAGLLTATAGTITYCGKPLTGPLDEVGYLTQQDTLMPWRNVLRNVEMPQEIHGVDKATRREAARQLVHQVGLAGFEHHYPRELSGGMRRRVSIARMLSGDPRTLLLDEPFSALDAQLRHDLQRQLLQVWTGSGRTVVFVTHDIEEALVLASRVVVLGRLGKILLDTPVDLPRPRDIDVLRTQPAYLERYEALAEAIRLGAQS